MLAGFESQYPTVIRSVRQRRLYECWWSITNHAQLAAFEALDPALLSDFTDMMFYEVDWKLDFARFLVLREGAKLIRSLGKPISGRFLNEVIDLDVWQFMGPIYNACAVSAQPVFSMFTIHDADHNNVQYERLLLPFGQGTRVQNILASVKKTALDGGFVNDGLMRTEGHKPENHIKAIIKPFSESASNSVMPGGKLESLRRIK